jgi:CTP:molybdopterin cytidylyltransferase MocA
MIELRVSALLLAAGAPNRMRPEKRSLPVENKTTIGQCIDAIIGSGIGDTVIVVNQQAAGSLKAFRDLPVRFAVTPGSGSETAESVKTGLRSLGDSASGILLFLADHPVTSVKTIRTLALEHTSATRSLSRPWDNLVSSSFPGYY